MPSSAALRMKSACCEHRQRDDLTLHNLQIYLMCAMQPPSCTVVLADWLCCAAAAAAVVQRDVLMASSTVRETLVLSAMLKLPRSLSTADKLARVDATLKELVSWAALGERGSRSWGGKRAL